MKILIVAPFGSPQRDEAIARGFRECGVTVEECAYGDLIYSKNLFSRIQFRLSAGPICMSLARRVRIAAERFKPDVIFFRRPLEFTPAMLKYIKRYSDALMVSFNNDDPFSPAYRDRRWRKMRAAIPLFDVHFAFRRRNLEQYRAYGAKAAFLWEPFYSPWLHRPLSKRELRGQSNGEILFAMHAERDGRRDAVLRLRDNGFPVRVYSWNWAQEFGKNDAHSIGVMQPVWGDEYVNTVQNAMATLCFFSKQNNDELTSRVFEIPACGGLLVAERNERISQLFQDGEEAILFSSNEELVKKISELRDNPDLVRHIKLKGYEHVLSSRHSVIDRCQDAMMILQKMIADPI